MRTRKVRKSRRLRRGGREFRYTNPTGSSLNLSLYSKQVGGSCKEKHKDLCKSSCKKLCHHVEGLPRKDFEYDMKYKINALKQTIDSLKQEHKRLADLAKAKYEVGKPPMYGQSGSGHWFEFDVSENTKCIDACSEICDKSEKATCEKVAELTHPTEDNLMYKFLLEQQSRLKSEIYAMKWQQGIR